jgi:predicted ATPase
MFRDALVIAERQGALLHRLRAADGLARRLVAAGQRDEARETLAPIYAMFTEGLGSHHLRRAGELLDALR